MRALISSVIARPLESLLYITVLLTVAIIMTTPYYYVALIVPLLVLFIMMSNRKPAYVYYMIVFLIPFGAYRTLSEAGHIKIHYLLAVILILYLLFKSFNMRHLPSELKSNLWPFMISLYVVTILTAMYSPYPEDAYPMLAQFAAAIAFITIGMYFIDKEALVKQIPAIVVYSVTLSSFLGVIGYLFNIALFAQKTEVEGEFKRGMGGSMDPNNTALIILFVLPLVAEMVTWAKNQTYKLLYMAFYVINMLAIYYTWSRSGAIFGILITAVIFLRHVKKINVNLIFLQIFFVLLIGAVVIGALPEKYMKHFGNITESKQDASIERRGTYVTVALDSFMKHPLIGTGLGTFRDIYAETDIARKFSRSGEDLRRFAHNTYLEYLVGVSSIGLLCFIALELRVVLNFYTARKNFLKNGEELYASYSAAYMFSFIAVILYLFMFSEAFHKVFLLSVSIAHVAHRLSLEKKQ
ncbi:MAG: O-antigen ligase family protein [Nitrospirae bacterium]|nr:O-antigen ligase family protein [Nitrospirota bacterium]